MTLLIRIACAATLLVSTATAQAQTYPEKPIRVILPLAAGSATDAIFRVAAPKMNALLGQSLIIENIPGAGNLVGTATAAKTPPDGYTILMAGSGGFAMNPNLHKNLPYDPVKDFTPICKIGGVSYVVAVNPALGVKTLPELLARAKAKPLSFASAGVGSTPHMAQEMFKARVGVDFVHVPYKGAQQAITDTVGGHADLVTDGPGPLLPMLQSGKLIPVGIMAPRRSRALPEVPTMAELGYPGLALQGWVGLVAPAGTPARIIDTLAQACKAAIASQEVQAHAQQSGFELDFMMPVEFATFIASELPKWRGLAQQAGIKPE